MPAALADGDPASDYLLAQSTFLSPFDGHIPTAERERADRPARERQATGLALKVAVIVTRYDLGAVPILFDKPQTYAQVPQRGGLLLLADELLVVMPNGYGLARAKGLPPADKAVIARLPAIHTRTAPR